MNTNASGRVRDPRNSGVDAFRLLCMLSVISAHANIYSPAAHQVAAMLSRWSVPFFFLVLGYFRGRNPDTGRMAGTIRRVFWMFLIASVLLLPLSLAKNGVAGAWAYVAQNGLWSGSYFHLWYLNSLLMGLLFLRLMSTPARQAYLPWVSLIVLVIAIALSSYAAEEARYVGRHLMSIPFLWLGTQLSRRVPSMRLSVALVAFGIGLEVCESLVLRAHYDRDFWHCPFTVGTVFYALGMFGIAFHLRPSSLLRRLGRLGARYSGSIYITHLYALAALHLAGSALHVQQLLLFRALVVPGALLLNVVALRLADRLSPDWVDGLLGSRPALARLGEAALQLPRLAVRSIRALPARP